MLNLEKPEKHRLKTLSGSPTRKYHIWVCKNTCFTAFTKTTKNIKHFPKIAKKGSPPKEKRTFPTTTKPQRKHQKSFLRHLPSENAKNKTKKKCKKRREYRCELQNERRTQEITHFTTPILARKTLWPSIQIAFGHCTQNTLKNRLKSSSTSKKLGKKT